jgi:hypothetical protein
MTIEQIKSEVQGLSEAEQNHLAAFLTHLRHSRDEQIREEITRRNADRNPSNWVSPDELRKHWES